MGSVRRPVRHARDESAKGEMAVRVLRRFRVVFNQVKTHFRRVERAAGVSGAQAWALSVIQGTPGIGIGELARAMDVHQSTASNLVKGLVERKLAVSEHGGEDRRQVQLYLTPGGQKALLKAPAPRSGVLPEALNALDVPTLARLERDLDALVQKLGADTRGASVLLGADPGADRRKT